MKRAVILLSGGLDSAVTLYEAKRRGYRPLCLVFDYGQRHRREIAQAVKIARYSRSPCLVVKISLPWQGSALLDKTVPLPGRRRIRPGAIPATYVPARNIIFLSFAASCAEAARARAVFIGANAIDYSGYPDCRPDFYRVFQESLRKGLVTGVRGKAVRIYTPLIRKTKAQIIRRAQALKAPYHLTWSCYKGGKRPCGECDSCRLRAKGFREAGLTDPALKLAVKRS